jgi:DNA-binding CsgD family transcriptional regulator
VGLATTEARDLVGAVAARIAHVVDPVCSVAALAGVVRDAAAGVVVTRAGAVEPLPGIPGHRLLHPPSDVLDIVREQFDSGLSVTSFVWPLAATSPSAPMIVRVTGLATANQPMRYLSGIVILSAAGDLAGLTERHLRLLGLLIEDQPPWRVAATLGLSRRTLADEIATVNVRLGTRDQLGSVLAAVNRGLYIPSVPDR